MEENTRDIIVNNFDLAIVHKVLISNSEIKIIYKQKYGLIGRNGHGKTTLLKYISDHFNKKISIFIVGQEINFDNNTSIYDIVSEANEKKTRIENKMLKLESKIESDQMAFDTYYKLNEKLQNLNSNKDESIIRKILFGLGFDYDAQSKPFGFFSGGWRMRVSIARGLYMSPQLLLLDEPTNHLDINSVIWLTDYLKRWKKTLLIVSHDVNFINQVCTKIIHIENKY